MCRLAAFPPGFPRDEAIALLKAMEAGNTDGTGYSYVRSDGKFVLCKHPGALSEILASQKAGKVFLSHMPYNGWTIAHLRNGTHGDNKHDNTHPFVAGEWCVAHNGTWSGYRVVRLALGRSIKWEGETDSEVAAHLINVCGPKAFYHGVDMAGVFLALNRTGELWVVKTSGLIKWSQWNKANLIATGSYQEQKGFKGFPSGWYRYGKSGVFLERSKDPAPVVSYAASWYDPDGAPESSAGVLKLTPGGDWEPVTQRELDEGMTGYYLDKNDGRYHPVSQLRQPSVEVPRDPGVRDWDGMTEDQWKEAKAEKDRNLPRHPPLPSVTQTTVPKLTPA